MTQEKSKHLKKNDKVKRAGLLGMLLALAVVILFVAAAILYITGGTDVKKLLGPDKSGLNGKIICLDAGGGIATKEELEQLYLGSNSFYNAYSIPKGNKHITENELTLKIVFNLKNLLEENGAEVYLTRNNKFSNITNVEKAEFANLVKADMLIEVFASESQNLGANGIVINYQGNVHTKEEIAKESKHLAQALLDSIIAETNGNDLGVNERWDLPSFNFSEVPTVRINVGFLSNPEEGLLLSKTEYILNLTNGIFNGICEYTQKNRL